MLQSYDHRTLRNVAVYRDDDPDRYATFHLVPTAPAWALDSRGVPQVRLFLYKREANAPRDDDAAWLEMATVLAVDDAVREAIRGDLAPDVAAEAARRGVAAPPITLLDVPVAEATAALTLSGPGGKEAIAPTRASKYGSRLATWSQALTPGGAAVLDAALRGGTTSAVQVTYTLTFLGSLPPLTVVSRFDASTFYRYVKDVDVEWDLWGEDDYRVSVSQQLTQSGSTKVEIDRRQLVGPEWDAVVEDVRDWAQRSLEDSIEKKLVLPVAPPTADEAKVPDGIEDFRLDVSQTSITSFDVTYQERSSIVLVSPAPALLPALGGLRDGNGDPLTVDDHITEVAPLAFFERFRVNIRTSADFETMPLFSVEVRLTYAGEPMLLLAEDDAPVPDVEGEFLFDDSDTVARFVADAVPGVGEYTYAYTVTYEDEDRKLEAGPFTTSTADAIQVIGVSDAGILDVGVHAGSIDFTTVTSARVTLSYEDVDSGVEYTEAEFALTADRREHRWQRVIFVPRRLPYRYTVGFELADGRTVETPWQEARGSDLYVDDPFTRRRTVAVRAAGDLDTVIDNIGVDLTYREPPGYVVEQHVDLNAANPFFDWSFPVMAEAAGVVSYSANVTLRNGGPPVRLPETEVTGPSVWIEPEIVPGSIGQPVLEVDVLADLVDFTLVRLVTVALRHDGAATQRKSLVFREAASQQWKVDLARTDTPEFTWSATFHLADGTRRTVGPTTTDDLTIVLDLPAA